MTAESWRCPTCGPHVTEPHPRRPGVNRCSNCKEWVPADSAPSKTDHPSAGTVVRLKAGMPGTYEGQTAVVHHQHPTSKHSNLPRLVWLECDVIWSHGTADGFWAARAEYVTTDEETTDG